jgi:IS1 family transposase
MEIDELWSFVDNKGNKIWIWIALCRKTRQIVARDVGDRSEKTCRELWNNVPKEYRKGQCFTDFWQAYQLDKHAYLAKRWSSAKVLVAETMLCRR